MSNVEQTQFIDDDNFYDIFVNECSDTENYYKVIDLACAIANSKDPEAVIAAFDRDPIFHDTFNSNGKNVLENMKDYIDASNESLKMDAIKWGPAGLIAGAYYQSLGRIKKVCSKYTADEKTMKRTSLYLPNKDVFFKCIGAAETLFKVVSSFNSNPNRPFETIIDALNKSGIKVKKGKVDTFIKFDWPQFWGLWLSNIVSSVIGGAATGYMRANGVSVNVASKTGGGLGMAGTMIAGRIFSRNGGPIGKRGWTPELLNEARQKVITLIEQFESLKQNKKSIDKNSQDLKLKLRLYKSTIDVYANLIKEAGRGVASALALIR